MMVEHGLLLVFTFQDEEDLTVPPVRYVLG